MVRLLQSGWEKIGGDGARAAAPPARPRSRSPQLASVSVASYSNETNGMLSGTGKNWPRRYFDLLQMS